MSMLRARPTRAVVIVTALCAAANGSGAGDDHHGHRYRGGLPQLSPATPAALVGACEDLSARLTGLADTVITASTTITAGTLSSRSCHRPG